MSGRPTDLSGGAGIVAAIGIGSNLGDRETTISAALTDLDRLPQTRLDRVSRLHETEPVGPPGQGPYLNGAALLRTTLPPRRLLEALLAIERSFGRDRANEVRHGPRTLDLDLLLYGDLVLDEAGLTIPHPRMTERRFVLEPLSEVGGELMHPVHGASVDSLRRAVATAGRAGVPSDRDEATSDAEANRIV
ncbi:MAG: 2-amino-4-hydroxy-6-hydroxymethyldihydropteridine diphosphokinase [Phycisphaerales bacterium]|jgi:2-amino-4-hydroxy-6-hydroxymethyldihydropteridine diphosphokinase